MTISQIVSMEAMKLIVQTVCVSVELLLLREWFEGAWEDAEGG